VWKPSGTSRRKCDSSSKRCGPLRIDTHFEGDVEQGDFMQLHEDPRWGGSYVYEGNGWARSQIVGVGHGLMRVTGDDLPAMEWELVDQRKDLPIGLQGALGIPVRTIRVSRGIDIKIRTKHAASVPSYESLNELLTSWKYAGGDQMGTLYSIDRETLAGGNHWNGTRTTATILSRSTRCETDTSKTGLPKDTCKSGIERCASAP